MKKVLRVVITLIASVCYVLIMLVCAKQALNYIYNEYVLSHYDKGDYSINDNLLLSVNILEPYIVHYNNGNILYKNCQYMDAIEEYEKALELIDPSDDKECKMHINMALSLIGTLPEDYDEYENIEDSIELLEEALDMLFDYECATEDYDGHSKDAEKLHEEIEDEIERLKEIQQQQQQQQQEEQEEQGGGSSDDSEDRPQEPEERQQQETEEDIREQIQEVSDRAYEERQIDLEKYEQWDIDYFERDFRYDGIW